MGLEFGVLKDFVARILDKNSVDPKKYKIVKEEYRQEKFLMDMVIKKWKSMS